MPALMEKFRLERLSIAEEVAELSRGVQSFLLDVKTERQKQAQEQATALRESFQKVQQDSRVFLTATQKQRKSKKRIYVNFKNNV
jgi:D-ribose pyranose/furanose isomerase RbsD